MSVGKMVMQHSGHFSKEDRLGVILSLFPPDLRERDIANFEKLLIDSLQKIIFPNDSQIDFMVLARNEKVKCGQAQIEIFSLFPKMPNDFVEILANFITPQKQ